MERIGNFVFNDNFYSGEDLYTDGDIEDVLLGIVRENRQMSILYESDQWPILYHLSDIRENLLEWYPFKNNSDILEVGSGCGALTGLLSRKARSVTCIELSKKRSMINAYRNKECDNVEIIIGNFKDIKLDKKFDYVTLIGVWEYSGLYIGGEDPYIDMLQKVKEFLKEDGEIIVAIENKMGMKYWNGAREDHTGKFYSSMNDYVSDKNVRTFSKPEIIDILKKVELGEYQFYYPIPDYKLPNAIYSEEYLPQPGNIRCYGQEYSMDRVYNFYDATIFDQVCNDHVFEYFSNSFLFICGHKKRREEMVIFSQYARERCEKFRICTYIKKEKGKKCVIKKALNECARQHIFEMKIKEEKWRNSLPKIQCVKGKLDDGKYIVPYIEGIALDEYLFHWRNNSDKFIIHIKEILEQYFIPEPAELIPFRKTREFESIFGNEVPTDKKSLKITNIDLVFSNLKINENKEIFNYDYEWIFDFEIPYEFVIWRILWALYDKYRVYLNKEISLNDFLTKFEMEQQNIAIYEKMQDKFSEYVFGENRNEEYLRRYRTKIIISSNKHNYIVDFMKKMSE